MVSVHYGTKMKMGSASSEPISLRTSYTYSVLNGQDVLVSFIEPGTHTNTIFTPNWRRMLKTVFVL